MAETITVDGVDRSGVVHREDCEWAESAYLGEVGEGRVIIHDDAGTITAAGFKDVTVVQSSATPTRIMTAFVGKKGIKRGSYLADPGTSREYAFATKDGNDLLQRLKIRAAAGNRPQETISACLTWLLADELSRVSVVDLGRVEYPTTVGVDAVDRRGQFPGDVLATLAKACRRNYYVRWNTTSAAWELVFRDDNASTADNAGITISNAGDDNGTSIFAPAMDDELAVDPEHVYSGMRGNYAKGSVYRTRPATATAFVERDGETEDAGTKTAATAERDADTALWESHLEEQLLPVKLHMRAAYVNLILPGQRVPVRMTHMTPEGWNPARYARVMRRKVTQPANTDFDYEVALDLSPQEAGPPSATILQRAFDRSADGGKTISFPNPVTVGSLLVFATSQRTSANPAAPNTGPGLPRFGAGAWTKVPNTQINTFPGSGSGAAIWVKAADSTESSCYMGIAGGNMGIWEIAVPNAASTIAALTSQYKTQQAESLTMTIGSLGTAAVGTVGIMIINWEDEVSGPDFVNALPTLASGVWTVRRYDSAYEGPWIKENTPYTVIADTLGAGAALSASITKGNLASPFVAGAYSGNWCGAAILITPV